MANSNVTTYAAWYKQFYPEKTLSTDLTKASPFLGLVTKRKAGGLYSVVPVKTAPNPGRSRTFSTAQGIQAAATSQAFQVPLVSDFGVVQLDGRSLRLANGDATKIADIYELATQDGLQNIKQSMAKAAWGDGGGSFAQALTSSDSLVTLQNSDMVLGLEPGMVLSSSATSTGVLRTGGMKILGVSRDGQYPGGAHLSMSAPIATSEPTFAATDYLFPVGDGANNGTFKAPGGVLGWLPATAPTTGDSWYTQDRSGDHRLFGRIFNATGKSIVEGLQLAGGQVGTSLCEPDYCFISPFDFAQLSVELGTNYRYEGVDADVGVQSVTLPIAGRLVKVVPEPFLPRTTAVLAQMDTWTYDWAGKSWTPYIEDFDGLTSRAVSNDDAYEVRLVSLGNFVCWHPYKNMRITNLGA